MVAIELSVNGRKLLTASVGKIGLLLALLRWRREESGESETDVEVCGNLPAEHVSWGNHELRVGDEVVLRLIETDRTPDRPVESIPFPRH